MKITRARLKQIIKEELENVMVEQSPGMGPSKLLQALMQRNKVFNRAWKDKATQEDPRGSFNALMVEVLKWWMKQAEYETIPGAREKIKIDQLTALREQAVEEEFKPSLKLILYWVPKSNRIVLNDPRTDWPNTGYAKKIGLGAAPEEEDFDL